MKALLYYYLTVCEDVVLLQVHVYTEIDPRNDMKTCGSKRGVKYDKT